MCDFLSFKGSDNFPHDISVHNKGINNDNNNDTEHR